MKNLYGGGKKMQGYYGKKKFFLSFLAIAKKRLVLQSRNIFFFENFRQFPFDWHINVSKKKEQ